MNTSLTQAAVSTRPKTATVLTASITLSTGSPQGCVLSPLLFTMLTKGLGCYNLMFSDDTAAVERVANKGESGYRQEVEQLKGLRKENNLKVKKTEEMFVNFRKGRHREQQ